MTLTFEPELIEGVEYTVDVVSSTELDVTLLAGHAWRAEPGKLYVKSLILDNSIFDDGGFQVFPHASDHWSVAEVTTDTGNDACTEGRDLGTHHRITASYAPVFQSALQQPIMISGAGFTSDLSFVLDPPLKVNVDYTLTVTSPTSAVLKLQSGKKWRETPGPLLARSFMCGGCDVLLAMVIADSKYVQDPPVMKPEEGHLRKELPYFGPPHANNSAGFYSLGEWSSVKEDVELKAERENMFLIRQVYMQVTATAKVRRALRSIDTAVGSDLVGLIVRTARDVFPYLVLLFFIAMVLVLFRHKKD